MSEQDKRLGFERGVAWLMTQLPESYTPRDITWNVVRAYALDAFPDTPIAPNDALSALLATPVQDSREADKGLAPILLKVIESLLTGPTNYLVLRDARRELLEAFPSLRNR